MTDKSINWKQEEQESQQVENAGEEIQSQPTDGTFRKEGGTDERANDENCQNLGNQGSPAQRKIENEENNKKEIALDEVKVEIPDKKQGSDKKMFPNGKADQHIVSFNDEEDSYVENNGQYQIDIQDVDQKTEGKVEGEKNSIKFPPKDDNHQLEMPKQKKKDQRASQQSVEMMRLSLSEISMSGEINNGNRPSDTSQNLSISESRESYASVNMSGQKLISRSGQKDNEFDYFGPAFGNSKSRIAGTDKLASNDNALNNSSMDFASRPSLPDIPEEIPNISEGSLLRNFIKVCRCFRRLCYNESSQDKVEKKSNKTCCLISTIICLIIFLVIVVYLMGISKEKVDLQTIKSYITSNSLAAIHSCDIENCKRCSADGHTCIQCHRNHLNIDGQCVECDIKNCDSCGTDGLTWKCNQCKEGHLKQSYVVHYKPVDQCTPCSDFMDGCKTCDGPTICQACHDHYEFHKNSTDAKATCRCKNPDLFSFKDKCKSCKYAMPHCSKCRSSTECETCMPTFVNRWHHCYCPGTKVAHDDRCVECKELINNCQECHDSKTCKKCQPRYINMANSCVEESKCAKEGKYLTSKGCISGIEGCTITQTVQERTDIPHYDWNWKRIGYLKCLECEYGRTLTTDTTCQKCEFGCENCIYKDERMFCLNCVDGYYRDNWHCKECHFLCDGCHKTTGKCLKCKEPHKYMVNKFDGSCRCWNLLACGM